MRTFREWKAHAINNLIRLTAEIDDEDRKRDLDALITKLNYLKARNLHDWLFLLYHAAKFNEKLLELLPTQEEIKNWIALSEE